MSIIHPPSLPSVLASLAQELRAQLRAAQAEALAAGAAAQAATDATAAAHKQEVQQVRGFHMWARAGESSSQFTSRLTSFCLY